MATVKGPLFSLDASGTIGKAVVFSKWKGRNYVRTHALPANPKSPGQLSVRAMLKFLSQFWTSLSANDQATWESRAEVTNVSPFNAYVGFNQKRWGTYAFPSQVDPPAETATPGTILSPTATAGSRSILLAIPISVVADNWGVAIHRSLITGFTPSRTTVIQVIEAESQATFNFLDTPLDVGVEQFYRFESLSDDGVSTVLVGEESATPTA